ncbi:hypothetical protein MW887_000548 [Aspergillus wentii]|nr:hypothetical protein MW887_000548 [Aspergillus wentii]
MTGPGLSLRITPSNSPVLRPAKSPNKPAQHQSTLSLQTIIGTTTTSPNGFSSHQQSKSFALCAGSAAVLSELDDENNMRQRFFKARPSATSINPVTSFYSQSTPPATPDARARSLSNLRSTGNSHNNSPSSEVADTGSPRPWSSRERIKAVTSVSISPDGNFLAVGETGYNPRALIFSTAKDSPSDIPLSIINEHTFGVRGLAFDSSSQYLATLGDVNDGFLFVWAVNPKNGSARLHSTNKCTTYVRDMCWMGQALITAGVRHVKVWRLPEIRPGSPTKSHLHVESTPSSPNVAPKALSGRNCLLGSLGDNTFTCVASISENEAVLGTDSGTLCFLNDSEGSQKLSSVEFVGFTITSLAVDSDQASVWIGGRGKRMRRFSFEYLRSSSGSAPSSPGSTGRNSAEQKYKGPSIACMGSLSSHLVTVDATSGIQLYPIDALDEDGEQSQAEKTIPAHGDSVLGIRPLQTPNSLNADFYTWSSNGSVNFWNTEGKCQESRIISFEQSSGNNDNVPNEMRTLHAVDDMECFVSGDKLGVLRVVSGQSWECVNEVRAHGGEITDIAVHSSPESVLVASCGRDRIVQLFQKCDDTIQLIQTMDDHVGSVGQLLFINDGEKLLSCSADRTVLVRERVTREADGATAIAYLVSKVITLKSSPMSMAISPDDPDILIVSTMDRCVHKFDIHSGRPIHSFRATDVESSDTVVINTLTVAAETPGQSPNLLIGASSTDKSIRVYDLERQVLLTGEFGHTEGMSALLLLENKPDNSEKPIKRTLISAGIDGVVMVWDLSVQPLQAHDVVQTHAREDDDTPTKEVTAFKPPLRRVLSRSELAEFQRPDLLAASPTPARGHSPPLVRRKLSKFSLTPSSLKSGRVASPSPSPSVSSHRSPTPSTPREHSRRSPSPPSPRSGRRLAHTSHIARQPSSDHRPHTKHSKKSEFGSLDMSTEQVCRTLRAYRKKLNAASEQPNGQKELERELNLTLRAINSRSKTSDYSGESVESGETETDSSGKENERLSIPSIHNQTVHSPRRMPSNSSLNEKNQAHVHRSHSLDADGEG